MLLDEVWWPVLVDLQLAMCSIIPGMVTCTAPRQQVHIWMVVSHCSNLGWGSGGVHGPSAHLVHLQSVWQQYGTAWQSNKGVLCGPLTRLRREML